MISPLTPNFLRAWRSLKNPRLLAYIQVRNAKGGKYATPSTVPFTVSVGSHRITGSGFTSAMEGMDISGAIVNGGYIPAGTYITDFETSAAMMMSKPCISSGSAIAATLSAGRIVRVCNGPLEGDKMPGFFYWQNAIIGAGSILAPGDWLTPGPNYCSASFTIADVKLNYQVGDLTASASLAEFQWQGAKVFLYAWTDELTDFADAARLFSGFVNRVEGVDNGITLHCIQRRDWNRAMPHDVIDVQNWPEAAESTRGLVVPRRYGDWRSPEMPTPWTGNWDYKRSHEDLGATGHVMRGIIVNPGTGPSVKAKVLFANHEMQDAGLSLAGKRFYVRVGDYLCPLDPSAGLTLINTANEFSIEIADETYAAYYPVRPTDIRTTSGTRVTTAAVVNPRYAINIDDPTTYAVITNDTAGGVPQRLVVRLPNLQEFGKLLGLEVVIGYSHNFNVQLRAYLWDQGAGAAGNIMGFNASATPVAARGTITGYTDGWSFGGSSVIRDLVIDGATSTSGSANIYFVGLTARFAVATTIVQEQRTNRKAKTVRDQQGRKLSGKQDKGIGGDWEEKIVQSALYQIEGEFFCNATGYKDDASGTFTGAANALIERPADIIHHLVQNANPNNTAGTFGSLIDARSKLGTRESGSFVSRLSISEPGDIADWIALVAGESLQCVFIDRFSDLFCLVPWRRQPPTDVDRLVKAEDIATLEWEETSDTAVMPFIEMTYGADEYEGPRFSARITDTQSNMGVVLNAASDQKCQIIIGVNDKFDIRSPNLSNFTATIVSGMYTKALALARQIQYQLRLIAGMTDCTVGYGCHIEAGYNDKLNFAVGATQYTATLPPGEYSPWGLAEAIRIAMTATVKNGWVVTFLPTTGGAGGQMQITGTATFTLQTNTGANRPNSAWPAAGFTMAANIGPSTTVTSGSNIREDHFFIAMPVTGLNLRWASGPNTGANIGKTIGFIDTADDTGSTFYKADNVRGARQSEAVLSVRRWGGRINRPIDLQTIRIFNVAGDVRDRLHDFRANPRIKVNITTPHFPDMQRMRVLEFDASVDSIRAYPGRGSNASWANRRFIVTEVNQPIGPMWLTQITGIEVSV